MYPTLILLVIAVKTSVLERHADYEAEVSIKPIVTTVNVRVETFTGMDGSSKQTIAAPGLAKEDESGHGSDQIFWESARLHSKNSMMG